MASILTVPEVICVNNTLSVYCVLIVSAFDMQTQCYCYCFSSLETSAIELKPQHNVQNVLPITFLVI